MGFVPPGLTIPYLGGKSAWQKKGVGKWVASVLPTTTDCTYVEPFAGMLGVLQARQPSRVEIVNDLDSRIVNWWRIVRDRGFELADKICLTPKSREEYETALRLVDDPDPLTSAWAVTVVLTQSVRPTLDTSPSSWRRRNDLGHHRIETGVKFTERILWLADRMMNVQIEHKNAVDLLADMADYGHTVIYVDPPYPTRKCGAAYAVDIDKDSLQEALTAQTGRVAISGYRDEWDMLGWEKHEYETFSTFGPDTVVEITEMLWTNYDAPRVQPKLF